MNILLLHLVKNTLVLIWILIMYAACTLGEHS